MKYTAIALAIALASTSAFAVNYGEPGNNPGNPDNPGVGGPPVTTPGGGNGGGGTGGTGGTGGNGGNSSSNSSSDSQSSSSAGSSTGNSSASVTVGGSGAADLGDTYKKYTPPGNAPSIDPTVPCAIPVALGIGVPGLSASGGSAYVDEGCNLRELIRIGLTSGVPTAKAKAATLLNRQLDEALEEDAVEAEEAATADEEEFNIWSYQEN